MERCSVVSEDLVAEDDANDDDLEQGKLDSYQIDLLEDNERTLGRNLLSKKWHIVVHVDSELNESVVDEDEERSDVDISKQIARETL